MNSPKKIGVWGSGVVGRSAIKYFLNKKDYKIIALADKKEPAQEFLEFLKEHYIALSLDTPPCANASAGTRDERGNGLNTKKSPEEFSKIYLASNKDIPLVPSEIPKEFSIEGCGKREKLIHLNFYLEENISDFLESCDYILPSPGIDLRKYEKYKNKFITEADIFQKNWPQNKPVIAVTGTIGKTSIVTLLSKILEQNNIKVATGGNIGTGMLDLLEVQANYDLAVLELSSFQLENCKSFAPDLAIITNIFPNHLDRHVDMQSYTQAKFNIFLNQKPGQKILFPQELKQEVSSFITEAHASLDTFFFRLHQGFDGHVASLTKITGDDCNENSMGQMDLNNRSSRVPVRVYRGMAGKSEFSLDTKFDHPIPDISYPINWIIIFAACKIMGIEIKNLDINALEIPDHRVEFVREFNGVEFYDDSKSTVCQATMAAVEKLKDKPLILFLGGISKGVDRSGLIKDLKNKVSQIICFGSEAETLNKFCLENSIPSSCHKTLEESFSACISQAQAGYRVLFSPSGASFDLFKDYKDRGEKFKNLVKSLK